MSVEQAVPKNHPMMIAWESYKASPEYANAFRWAEQEPHRAGSMWAAFVQGYAAALSVIAAESGWRTIESAPDDREWTPETPFHFKSGVAVAYDDETVEPLFLVWYAPCQGGCETTHWMPLPPAPFRHRRRAG